MELLESLLLFELMTEPGSFELHVLDEVGKLDLELFDKELEVLGP